MQQKPHAGASGVHGSERSKPTEVTAEAQPPQIDAISVLAPWCDETERGLRDRIHRARDSATARATRCRQGNARTIYWLAGQMASERVFARMRNEDLKETIEKLAMLFLVAGWIERTETPDVE
jgi:hypothetical protein